MDIDRQLFMETANMIEAEPKRFDQSVFASANECGTVHCIAGWFRILRSVDGDDTWMHRGWKGDDRGMTKDIARSVARLSRTDAYALFCVYWPMAWYETAGLVGDDKPLRQTEFKWTHEPDAEQAAAILRGMAKDPDAYFNYQHFFEYEL